MITLLAGLAIAGCSLPAQAWGGVVLGAVFIGISVMQFRLPHVVTLTAESIEVRGRFGAARRWASATIVEGVSHGRALGEYIVLVGAAYLLSDALGGDPAAPTSGMPLFWCCLWSVVYMRWRGSVRVLLSAPDGRTQKLRPYVFKDSDAVVAAFGARAA
jgi:hypothetical protein